MKSKKRILASALAFASLAVSSKAQGVNTSMLVKLGLGVAGVSTIVGFASYLVDCLGELSLKYKNADKVIGSTVNAEEAKKVKEDCIGEAVKNLAGSISAECGYYMTSYREAPAGFLRVSCGGQQWYVCFIKNDCEIFALCGKDRFRLVHGINKLRLGLVEKHFNNNNELVSKKDELGKQVGMFTWHIVNSLLPEGSEEFKEAVWKGLCPVMLDKMWDTFSDGQFYFDADSEQAGAIVNAVEEKNNHNNFALFID